MFRRVFFLFILAFSSSVFSSTCGANGHGAVGNVGNGFGQNACKLPSGEFINVPWYICELKDGRSI
ncbi:hypothetical protein [Photobacterium leiognathi]|uniref:hypothetical protein n=1 Tax=Photobacterium leiognathi TaxID=553611 RepID=UPI0029812358|nr:hypothetical protein [Photobacterium leiognathi]